MKTLHLRKTLSVLLVAAMAVSALCLTGCSSQPDTTDTTAQPAATTAAATTEAATTEAAAATEVGEGSTSFAFQVTFADGSRQDYTVKTDSTVVGEALQDAGLIAGEESEYGLYVKTVAGQTLDYDADGMYWAFYVNGEYATSGVDTTNIDAGSTYEFRAESGT
ncbi:MAG: DUF4430 domain-containing protein [Faecousia sp.]